MNGVEGDKNVRDHCHYSGKFRGAAHNKCTSLFRKPKFVPVLFHNLRGYDAHLFIKYLHVNGGDNRNGQIDCIPNADEKYINFSKSIYDDEKKFIYKIRFIDSFKFMSTSLDKLIRIRMRMSSNTQDKHLVMNNVNV